MPAPRLNSEPKVCAHGAIHSHGTTTMYARDECRCTPCADAESRRNEKRRKAKAYGRWQSATVDATRARVHLLALRQHGIGYARAATLAGLGSATCGDVVSGNRPRILRRVEAAILAVPLDAERAPGVSVSAIPARRRIQALAYNGWPFRTQWVEAGMSHMAFKNILTQDTIRASTDRRIRDLFDRLWDVEPPVPTRWHQTGVTKAKNLARRNGWVPGLAWDDIDDPDETPTGARQEKGNRRTEDVIEDLDWLRRTGTEPGYAAARLGISYDSLRQALKRHGRGDLLDWLATKAA